MEEKKKEKKVEMKEIRVSDYYGNTKYYNVMPSAIFDALELAYLKGEETCKVAASDFDKMESDYQQD